MTSLDEKLFSLVEGELPGLRTDPALSPASQNGYQELAANYQAMKRLYVNPNRLADQYFSQIQNVKAQHLRLIQSFQKDLHVEVPSQYLAVLEPRSMTGQPTNDGRGFRSAPIATANLPFPPPGMIGPRGPIGPRASFQDPLQAAREQRRQMQNRMKKQMQDMRNRTRAGSGTRDPANRATAKTPINALAGLLELGHDHRKADESAGTPWRMITMRWIEASRRAGCRYLAATTAISISIVAATAGELRLNQIQVIGTHNSYHIAGTRRFMIWWRRPAGAGGEGLDYSHRPLAEQFSRLGIREVELDVFADPEGGLFAEPNLRKMVKNRGKDPGPDPAANGKLGKPGFKVLHVQDVDFRTHTPTFVDALKQIRSWSRAHRQHVPIMIMIELKDEAIFGLSTKPAKFGREEVDKVDTEILSVFNRSEILTPDRVRGRFETLPEAIRSQGWPALDTVRGLVMFSLENENSLRQQYLDGHQSA